MQQTTRVAGINNNNRWFGQKKLFSWDLSLEKRKMFLLTHEYCNRSNLWFIRFVDRDVAVHLMLWGQQNFLRNGLFWLGVGLLRFSGCWVRLQFSTFVDIELLLLDILWKEDWTIIKTERVHINMSWIGKQVLIVFRRCSFYLWGHQSKTSEINAFSISERHLQIS